MLNGKTWTLQVGNKMHNNFSDYPNSLIGYQQNILVVTVTTKCTLQTSRISCVYHRQLTALHFFNEWMITRLSYMLICTEGRTVTYATSYLKRNDV